MSLETMTKLATYTVPVGGVASYTFSNIPQNYTDLVIKASVRTTAGGNDNLCIKFNGSTSGYTNRRLYGTGASVASDSVSGTSGGGSGTAIITSAINTTASTTSTFCNTEIYIPNYTSANYKSLSSDGVTENNSTTAYTDFEAGLWSNTAAITSLTLLTYSGNSMAQYSTLTLYGVYSKTPVPNTPVIGTASPLATTSALVSFTPVDYATSYTVTSFPGNVTATGNTTPVLISGLLPSTSYTFKVQANNSTGSSSQSSATSSITTGASSFLATWESGANITVSGDGINWTRVQSNLSNVGTSGTSSITKFGSTYIVGISSTTKPLTVSTDLVNWEEKTISGGTSYAYLYKVATNGTLVVAAGGTGGYNSSPVVKTSTDLTTWTDRTSGLTYNIYAIGYGNGYFLVTDGNGNYSYSTNGTTWTAASSVWSSGGVGNISRYFNGRWYFAGNGGEIRYSSSINPGTAWTNATGQASVQVQAGEQNGSMIVFGHNDGSVSRSTNGTSFTNSSTGASFTILGITYGNGLWVATGRNANCYTSPDAITWTQRVSGVSTGAGGAFGVYFG